MILSLKNLQAGLQWWQEKSGWGKDFLNGEYYDIYELRSAGFTEAWWNATVDRLWNWRAIRSPRRPNTKREIKATGISCLSEIGAYCEEILGSSTLEPSIVDLHWEDISSVFELASQFKPGPVFPSKMCHFLFPKLFIPMDNLATCLFEYEFYWRGMKDEWTRFRAKDEALGMLTDTIESDKPIHGLYPMETKVMELCHIGYQHRLPDASARGLEVDATVRQARAEPLEFPVLSISTSEIQKGTP